MLFRSSQFTLPLLSAIYPSRLIAINKLIFFISSPFNPINWNLKYTVLWAIIDRCTLSIKFSKSLENKGFITVCSMANKFWLQVEIDKHQGKSEKAVEDLQITVIQRQEHESNYVSCRLWVVSRSAD